jgi:hypothetical protein
MRSAIQRQVAKLEGRYALTYFTMKSMVYTHNCYTILPLNRLLMTAAPVPSLYGFKGIFSAMLQISRFVVCHELDDTRP